MNFTPSANRALNKQEPYSRPISNVPEKIVLSQLDETYSSAQAMFNNIEQSLNQQRSRSPHVSR